MVFRLGVQDNAHAALESFNDCPPRSAVLAHVMLNERLNIFGIAGCMLCIVGSMTIVLHAPEEREVTSLLQVWNMALQPGLCSQDQLECPALCGGHGSSQVLQLNTTDA
jgi:hypothetical protein